MNNIETRISRDRDGWRASSSLDLPGNRLLQIRTYKNQAVGALRTHATVHTKTEGGGLQHIMGFGTGGGDYSEVLAASKPARVTEKVVCAQHESALKSLPSVLAAVEAHYAKKPSIALPA